ncbi:hypothetical protein MUP56_03300 [Patescibacteria group bacterium]|nr:hypothetical protein [Patescibacteria group bacterium]
MEEIETGLPQIDPEQAAQLALWRNRSWSVIEDLHARQKVKAAGILAVVVGVPVLVYVLPQIIRDLR